ncbi:TraR/DksA family transcriptional regulator [uncultured Ralstonia sp.]|jgi:DnaK suppressor protein|uniref:TraR/DksA family transcriptional regulator n=1 Tax=Ralstonia sp. TaxID=54061 RepID=UPI001EAC2F86|nr:TraR/DksA family transcriptional regulator [uncultured Ralstonia sp.]UCF22610.1 MAG: TraR/DksA family transcriptional regulator [Ralstonia sp.]
MTRLTEAQWHRLITLLDEQEARVRRQVGALEPEGPDADAMSTAEPYEEVDLADQEATERASDVMLEHYRAELVQIGATRARIQQGLYGICVDCGAEIPFLRLQAQPTALCCLACQNKRERQWA